MTSLHPDTFAPRYTDYRKATADGRVTKSEAKQLAAEHTAEVAKDPRFAKAIDALLSGNAKWLDFSGGNALERPVHVTSGARTVLQQMLGSEADVGPRLPTAAQMANVYGAIADAAMANGTARRLPGAPDDALGAARFNVTPEGLQDVTRQVFLMDGQLYLQLSSLMGPGGKPSSQWYAVGPAPLF